MRRPLPPDLVVLGDHLEGAVRRHVGRRRTRRQLALNAVTSMLVALPLAPAVLGTVVPPAVAPAVVAPAADANYGGAKNDFPPRGLRGADVRADDALAEPTTLRRALR